ncbi:MAG: NAD(+) synthase [Candidatus Riflebacteria bacterium]|nr:NAD(+) synthase [Candidatus Riflebacteria bacterium]
MVRHGFVRVAAAAPEMRVGDPDGNATRLIQAMERAEARWVEVLVFPELCLTGYTCADLFHQAALLRGALTALQRVAREGEARFSGLALVGLPVAVDDRLFNCAAVVHRGHVLGLVPKSFIPNYKEFYEGRWFAPAAHAHSSQIWMADEAVPFGPDLLFEATDVDGLVVGVEICEDLWVPVPPSSFLALGGATVLANLSASNDLIGKAGYRRQLVVNQSGRCIAAYVYASCGVWESTTDVVFGGHCMIAENASLVAESARFSPETTLTVADVDLDRMRVDRQRQNSFGDSSVIPGGGRPPRRVPFALQPIRTERPLERAVDAHPFVPGASQELGDRCEEIFQLQVAGLWRRLCGMEGRSVVLGVSGGLDSTLALLVATRTMDRLQAPRDRIRAFTMPGFGTSDRTLANARALMRELGVSPEEVDIRGLCLDQMRLMGHRPFGIDLPGLSVEELTDRLRGLPDEARHDLVFENVQARMRTSVLMNAGFVIGTGDLSELALGWCTYNGDHMSMYNPNAGIPKTLVRFLVRWVAQNVFDGETRRVLLDVVDTEISPELLPARADGRMAQSTEASIGPYELVDFFMYHLLRFGFPPEKILYLARHARFDRAYSPEELRRWLALFIRRFFANQFKRSCLPDGPKVGSISLSPRGDWRMPSDADATLWSKWVESDPT